MRTYAEVRELCIKKLAQILCECIACSHVDRQMLDWLTAEEFVDANKAVVDGIYDCFLAATAILAEQTQDFATFNKVCGRAVWDSLYQPLKKKLGLSYQLMPSYTHILFS